MRHAILPLALLLLAGTASSGDPEFTTQRDSLRAAYSQGTGEDRLAAVEAVASFANEDSTRLLISIIPTQMDRIEALVEQREAIRTGRDRSLHGRPPENYLRQIKKFLDLEYRIMETLERGIATLTDEDATDYLADDALTRAKHWKAREVAARALGSIGARKYIRPLAKALRDKDARVRTGILLSLAAMRAEEAVDDVVKALSDKDWTVRSAAIEALGKIMDPHAFEALLGRMEEEDGVLADACADALKRITGQDFGRSPDAWERWWEDHGEKLLEGARPEEPKPVEPEKPKNPDDERYYHGIEVKSHRTIFILDVSESMSYAAFYSETKPKPGELTRLAVAKRELVRAIRNYSPKGTFALIAFNTVIKVWRPRLVPAKTGMKKDAEEWVNALEPVGTTNIYGALEAAFRMAGMGLTDRYYQPTADTIFLLSDGAPTNQDLSNDDPDRVLRAVRHWNRLNRMTIHTIGMRGHSQPFMEALAMQNGGTYISRE